jgi:hypothetical protein
MKQRHETSLLSEEARDTVPCSLLVTVVTLTSRKCPPPLSAWTLSSLVRIILLTAKPFGKKRPLVSLPCRGNSMKSLTRIFKPLNLVSLHT